MYNLRSKVLFFSHSNALPQTTVQSRQKTMQIENTRICLYGVFGTVRQFFSETNCATPEAFETHNFSEPQSILPTNFSGTGRQHFFVTGTVITPFAIAELFGNYIFLCLRQNLVDNKH